MEKVINLGIPHVAEQIFESFNTEELINFMDVSKTWKALAENVLLKRWTSKSVEACKNGETKVVKLLLDNKNDEFHSETILRWSEFMWACHNGHKDVVKLLLEHSNDHKKLNARNGHGWTPFTRACQNGHIDVVKFLLEHFDRNVDLNPSESFKPFVFACSKGHADVVRLLLNHNKTFHNIALEFPHPGKYGGWSVCGWTLPKDIEEMLMDQFPRNIRMRLLKRKKEKLERGF